MHFTENCFPRISREDFCLCFALLRCNRSGQSSLEPRHAASFTHAAIWNTLRFYQVKKHSIRRKRDEAARSKSRERVCARVAYFSRYVYAYGFQTVEKQKHNVNIRESSRRKNGNGNRERTRQSFRKVQITLQFTECVKLCRYSINDRGKFINLIPS